MRAHKRLRRWAGAVGLVSVLAGGLIWAAAATGQVVYVATHGTSMQPQFDQGDLAVVRPAASYEAGDVVAYRSDHLDTIVLHRIVAQDGGHNTLKGDNNSWLDRDRPTEADMIGAVWVRIPRGGAVINAVRGQTLVLPVALLLLLGGGTATAIDRRRRKGSTRTMPAITRSRLHGWRSATAGLGVLAAACAALGLAGLTRPTTETTTAPVGYTHAGEFTYSAVAPAGPVYETGTVRTGDPVYLRLVPALDVAFTYTFASPAPHLVSGTIALAAEVADGTGWTRRVQIQPAFRFEGERAEAHGRLAVADLQALVSEVRTSTGVQGGSATITLIPDIRLDATVAGAPIKERFQPRLPLQLDPLQLRHAGPAADSAEDADDELHPREEGTAGSSETVTAHLELMGRSLAVTDARRAGVVAVPAALAALVAGVTLRRRLRAETARIELRHGHRIIPVAAADRHANLAVVDVTTMKDLTRLSEQENCLILHERNANQDVYLFQTDRTIYRYRLHAATS